MVIEETGSTKLYFFPRCLLLINEFSRHPPWEETLKPTSIIQLWSLLFRVCLVEENRKEPNNPLRSTPIFLVTTDRKILMEPMTDFGFC